MAYELITRSQLANRLSETRLQRIYDDNNDGTADSDPVQQLIQDASSKVLSYCGSIYKLDVAAAAAAENKAHELVRLTLDVAQAMAAQRFPEVVRVDWVPMMQSAEKDLKQLMQSLTRLDTADPPSPPANCAVGSDPNDDETSRWDAGRAYSSDDW
jgi:phage gp36-like protein